VCVCVYVRVPYGMSDIVIFPKVGTMFLSFHNSSKTLH
jgi:hypothetical protein